MIRRLTISLFVITACISAVIGIAGLLGPIPAPWLFVFVFVISIAGAYALEYFR